MKQPIFFLFLLLTLSTSNSFAQPLSDSTLAVSQLVPDSANTTHSTSQFTLRKPLLYSILFGSIGGLGGFVVSLPIISNQGDGFEQAITLSALTAIGATTGFIWGAYHGYNLEQNEQKHQLKSQTELSHVKNATIFSFLLGSGSYFINNDTQRSYNIEFIIRPKTRKNYFPNEYSVVVETVNWYGTNNDGSETKLGLRVNYDLNSFGFFQSHFLYGFEAGISSGFRNGTYINQNNSANPFISSEQKDYLSLHASIFWGMQISFFEFLNCRVTTSFEPIGAQSFIRGKEYSASDKFSIDASIGLNLFSLN